MLFILIGVVLIICSIVAYHYDNSFTGDVPVAITVITVIYWFSLLFGGGIGYAYSNTEIDKYLEFKEKIENYQEIYPYRQHLSEAEILQAFRHNHWIAKGKINDKSFLFGFFTPNRFRDLELIESDKLFW